MQTLTSLYQSDPSEPAVRLGQFDTVSKSYADLLAFLQLNTQFANTVWALLTDGADMIRSRTSSRNIERTTGVQNRTVRRYLEIMCKAGLLIMDGRSMVEARYIFNREKLLELWLRPDNALPDCVVSNANLNALANEWELTHPYDAPTWIVLLCMMQYDYPRTAVLLALISGMNANAEVSLSCRDIAHVLSVPHMTIQRSLKALEDYGLISRLDVQSRRSNYVINLSVLRALLEAPLPDFRVLPGITPLSALQRLFPVTPTPNEGGVQ